MRFDIVDTNKVYKKRYLCIEQTKYGGSFKNIIKEGEQAGTDKLMAAAFHEQGHQLEERLQKWNREDSFNLCALAIFGRIWRPIQSGK